MKRRDFLGSISCAALGSIGVTSTLLNLKMVNNAVAAPPAGAGDYRALVCVFLHGGNDSYNMLVPTATSEYNNYSLIRSNLALPAPGSTDPEPLLPLVVNNTPGRTFGVHGAMPHLQTRFNEGNAAFVANVGTLVEPTSIADINSGQANLPRALFSHNDQRKTWQTSVAQTNFKTGWAGRLADRVMVNNASSGVSMNISLEGNQIMLSGESSFPYSISEIGAARLTGSGSSGSEDIARVQASKNLVEETQRNILMRAFAEEKKSSYDSADLFAAAFESVNLSTSFGNTNLARHLKAVATTLAARDTLGQKRQIFFVSKGGFDNHAELLNAQSSLLTDVDSSLNEFWNALVELGLEDEVTVFTCSDFGRTIRSNGLGTDHAWGGHSIVMGGTVNDGRTSPPSGGEINGSAIYGSYPDPSQMTIGAGLDFGTNGRYVPTTSVDEYFAELALWFGLPPGELENVFPNLGNFYTYSSTTPPLGFILG
ncbi:MAG: DUF1501 domain-containing protein [Verrucomicrobiota bacterium]